MGINLKEEKSWFEITQKHRETHKCICQKPENQGKYCIVHGYQFSRPVSQGNIHTTPEAEKFIQAHTTKLDEKGKAIVSTARGRRRKEKRNK